MTDAPGPINDARAILLQALETELAKIEEASDPPASAVTLQPLLAQLIEGLKELDHGQVPHIFAPAAAQFWGSQPATAHALRMTAVQYVEVLRSEGYSASKARKVVGDAYGVAESTLDKWRVTLLRNEMDKVDLYSEVKIYSSMKKLGLPHSVKTLLGRITKHGQTYRQAITKKTQS